jgi:hypothetical protein
MSILASAVVYTRAGLAISQTHAVPRLLRESHPAVISLAGLLAPPNWLASWNQGYLKPIALWRQRACSAQARDRCIARCPVLRLAMSDRSQPGF